MKHSFKHKIAVVGIVIVGILAGCGKETANAEKSLLSADSGYSMEANLEKVKEAGSTEITLSPMGNEGEAIEAKQLRSPQGETEPEATNQAIMTEADTMAADVTDPTIISESPAEIKMEEEIQQSASGSLEARLVNKHYAGDVLKANDFYIKVTRGDGTVQVNPLGWDANPLELVEGDNLITVIFEDYTAEIHVNVGVRPAAQKQEVEDAVIAPVSENPKAFAVKGSSVLQETPDMGQEYLDKIIFLGDSRTYSYKAYGVLSGGKKTKQVWTPKSGTMTLSAQSYAMIVYPETGKDMSIRDAVALKKPEYMIIGLGTNGISYMDEEDFRNEYFSLINDIKEISPDTKIMINSMFPIANYYKRLDLINNEKIARANQWLVKIAEETGVKYLNTAEVLVDKDGWLNIDYDNGGEATHLNRQGNDIVMRYIRTHGYQE